MADTQRISQIPVMTSRPHASSVSSPHLGLVPPSRYPSVSGSPTMPTPSSPSSSSSGGSTPFRSFRNFLSFGVGNSNKHATSPSVSAIPKSHFSTLGPVRRSVNVERRVSSPHLNKSRRSEDDYVLSIDLPRPGDDGLNFMNTRFTKSSEPSPTLQTPSSQSALSSRSGSPNVDSTGSSPDTPALAATELSTIIESETSGISKHLPSLDTSRDSLHPVSPNSFQHPALHPSSRDTRRGSSSPSNDTSALDLSTSKLTSEVLAALSEAGGKQDWLRPVVVDDATSESAISRERTPESPDASFNLNSLDPDLAALLSPNRAKGSTEPALLVAINAIPPPSSSSPPPSLSVKSPSSTSNSPGPSEAQTSSSVPRAVPTSLGLTPRFPSSSTSLPRITRSVSDRPAFGTTLRSGPPSPITRTPSGRAMSTSPERPTSLASAPALSRLARSPATDIGANSSFRRPTSSGHTDGRRTAASRLMTPSRPSSSAASSPRPPLSRLHSGTNPWETDLASPSSRPPSSVGTAPSRLQHRGPSLDMERPRLTGSIRTRKRSTSVIENRVTLDSSMHAPSLPAPRSMTDWLGPRTAKAFAAAGLLDFEKDSPGSASRPSSRFGTTRSSIDRDSRSRYTPSRMAFSEAGSSSSWGARSGSVSRAAGYSEAAGPLSEAMSTPRTVFSSASTAPTSISASSAQHAQLEVQQLQDKHALETSALLNALADSQRTTKMLRDENAQLRDRIQMLEDKLADTQERIQQILYSQPPVLAPKAAYGKRFGSPSASERRGMSHSRTNSFVRGRGNASPYADIMSSPDPATASPETPYDHAEAFVPPSRKRMSGASSVFATLPSNMSMLMREEGASPDAFAALSLGSSSPAGSPTMVYARLHGPSPSAIPKAPSSRGLSHRANNSTSSAGNISPTTASFSVMTSSPGSLNLRPEHERHLGDMPPLDLDADEFEFDESLLALR